MTCAAWLDAFSRLYIKVDTLLYICSKALILSDSTSSHAVVCCVFVRWSNASFLRIRHSSDAFSLSSLQEYWLYWANHLAFTGVDTRYHFCVRCIKQPPYRHVLQHKQQHVNIVRRLYAPPRLHKHVFCHFADIVMRTTVDLCSACSRHVIDVGGTAMLRLLLRHWSRKHGAC